MTTFPEPQPGRRKLPTTGAAVVVLTLLALAQGAVIARLLTADAPAPSSVPAPTLPVVITSGNAGDVVFVDGRAVGVTPFQLTVDGSVREIRLQSLSSSQSPSAAGAPAASSAVLANPIVDEAAVPARRSGGLALSSPIEIQLIEGDRVLGSSADGSIVMTAGVHRLELVNSAFGYRERRTVEVKSGQVIPLVVKPPDGRLNINALPWAQVWVDGKPVGETPLANVAVPVGQHEIVFRHPQLGERRETAMVKSGAVTRLSVTLSQ